MSFLKGNLITMADGYKKKIEELTVGELVKNGFGRNVFVTGVCNLNNFRRYVKKIDKAIKINNEIVCLRDQAFVGADENFYVLEGSNNSLFYELPFIMFNGYNKTCVNGANYNINSRLKPLEIGSIILKENGPVEVNSIEFLDTVVVDVNDNAVWDNFYNKNITDLNVEYASFMPIGPDIYRNKIGFNGTYIVDDYVCLAMQNAFWDYDKKINYPETDIITYMGPDGIIERKFKDQYLFVVNKKFVHVIR